MPHEDPSVRQASLQRDRARIRREQQRQDTLIRQLQGRGFTPLAVKVHYTSNTRLVIPDGTSTAVPFNIALFDSTDGAMWSAGDPTKLVAPVHGVYCAVATYMWHDLDPSDLAISTITKGGQIRASRDIKQNASFATTFSDSLTATSQLQAGETMELEVYQSNGTAADRHLESASAATAEYPLAGPLMAMFLVCPLA
jgi:hypothetical protein